MNMSESRTSYLRFRLLHNQTNFNYQTNRDKPNEPTFWVNLFHFKAPHIKCKKAFRGSDNPRKAFDINGFQKKKHTGIVSISACFSGNARIFWYSKRQMSKISENAEKTAKIAEMTKQVVLFIAFFLELYQQCARKSRNHCKNNRTS